MRTWMIAGLVACSLGAPATAQNADMSGDWHVWSSTVTAGAACTQFIGNEVIYHTSLAQDASGNLTGVVNYAASGAFLATVTGTVVGTQVTLSGTAFQGATQTNFSYDMTAPLGSNVITGTSSWTFISGAGNCSGTDDVQARRLNVHFCDESDGSACPCGNNQSPGFPGGCLNSTGQGAVLSETGIASLANDTLEFSISGARPSQPGIFLQGSSVTSVPFKDGHLCTGNPTERVEVAFTDALGTSASVTSIAAGGSVSGFLPTRYYQYWYRDPAVSPCGTGSNFSNALEISWLP